MLIGPIGEKGKERDNGSKPLNKQKHMTSKPYIYIYITLETQTKAANRTRIRYSLFLIAFRPLWLGPWAPRSAERSRPPQPSRGPTRSHTGRVPGGGCACCRNIRLSIATHIKKTCLVSCLVSRENCWMLSVQSFLQVFASPRLSQGVKKRRVS